ncbi:MAG TPA: (d)CMP kinase [bacterium]|jgi:cytidylate kinase|nr:(d)CMP kinase [Dictyoglomota bacterium]HOP55349.1 (d)CMP kinase [bacterium]
MSLINIALDGPAGSGKSTVGKIVSLRLSYDYLDTGMIYRGIAWWLSAMGWEESIDINGLISNLEIISWIEPGFCRIIINGIEPPSDKLYSREISDLSSKISAYGEIRDIVNKVIKILAGEKGTVVEGRDIGSVVLPQAEVKIFLTASNEELARRRYMDFQKMGETVSYETVLAEIVGRNIRDSNREIAPLKMASDAIHIDSTNLKIQEVVDKILTIVNDRLSRCFTGLPG